VAEVEVKTLPLLPAQLPRRRHVGLECAELHVLSGRKPHPGRT
jgi:hypothetical protein